MKYKIYVFLDNKNRPYYVGKTNDIMRRRAEHIEEIETGNTLPKYTAAKKLIRSGHPLKMRTIATTDSEKEAWGLEHYYIKKFRRDGYRLFNLTSGGPLELPIKLNNPKRENQRAIISEPIVKTKKIKKAKKLKAKKKRR